MQVAGFLGAAAVGATVALAVSQGGSGAATNGAIIIQPQDAAEFLGHDLGARVASGMDGCLNSHHVTSDELAGWTSTGGGSTFAANAAAAERCYAGVFGAEITALRTAEGTTLANPSTGTVSPVDQAAVNNRIATLTVSQANALTNAADWQKAG
jgi:hypothetical protein